MKIKHNVGGEVIQEKVVRNINGYFFTESGAQVHESSVISTDSRGGARKGAGRKPLYGEKSEPVQVYLSPDEIAAFKSEAESRGLSLSSLIRNKMNV